MEYVFVWLGLAALVGLWASSGKGRSCLGWAILAILISPLLAGLLLLIVGSGRRCPYCGGDVPKHVTVCRHCGRNLATGER